MAIRYFSQQKGRLASLAYYQKLMRAIESEFGLREAKRRLRLMKGIALLYFARLGLAAATSLPCGKLKGIFQKYKNL